MKKQNRDSISYNAYKTKAWIEMPVLIVGSITLGTWALISDLSLSIEMISYPLDMKKKTKEYIDFGLGNILKWTLKAR